MAQFKVNFRFKEGQIRTEEMTSRQLFGDFISGYVSTLVERGLVYESEVYKSHITPRYDDMHQFGQERVYTQTPEKSWLLEEDVRAGWRSESQVKGLPLTYFTLSLLTLPRGLVYKKDFPLATLNKTLLERRRSPGVESTELLQQQRDWDVVALEEETSYSYDFLPYSQPSNTLSLTILIRPRISSDDISASEAPLMLSVDDIIDTGDDVTDEEPLTISVDDVIAELPIKPFPLGAYQSQGTKNAGDLNIIITKNTLEETLQEATKWEDAGSGGMLIGEAFKEETTGELVILITDHIQARVAKPMSLWFTSEVWDNMLRIKEQRHPNEQIVGWYRNHFFGDELLPNDEFIHKNVFKEPWHVVLVLGRYESTWRFFQWKGDEIVPCNAFHVFE